LLIKVIVSGLILAGVVFVLPFGPGALHLILVPGLILAGLVQLLAGRVLEVWLAAEDLSVAYAAIMIVSAFVFWWVVTVKIWALVARRRLKSPSGSAR